MTKALTKALAAIEDSDNEDKFGPNGGFTAILSTPSQDRDGDILGRDEWVTPLPDRLPLDIDHEMSVTGTIGSFHPYFEGDTLYMDAYFASTPKAQEVRTLVTEGHVRSVSVAFITDKSKKDGDPRRELLNAGIVAIPANRDAVILAAKGVSDEIMTLDQAVEIINKAAGTRVGGGGDSGALTQAIHDAAVHLGAVCIPLVENVQEEASEKAAEDVETKTEDDAETKTTVEDVLTALTPEQLDEFKAALDKVLTPQSDSTDEAPAETAAASEEEPAPVEDAAAETTEDTVDPDKRARDMQMSIFAFQNSYEGTTE